MHFLIAFSVALLCWWMIWTIIEWVGDYVDHKIERSRR